MSKESARIWYLKNKEKRKQYSFLKNRKVNRRRYEPTYKIGIICICGKLARPKDWFCSDECFELAKYQICKTILTTYYKLQGG